MSPIKMTKSLAEKNLEKDLLLIIKSWIENEGWTNEGSSVRLNIHKDDIMCCVLVGILNIVYFGLLKNR